MRPNFFNNLSAPLPTSSDLQLFSCSLTSSHLFSTFHLTQLLSRPSAFLTFSHMLSTFLAFSQPFSHPFFSCLSAAQLFAQALDFSRLISTLFSPLLVLPQLFSTSSTCVQLYPPFPTLLTFRVNSSHLASAFLTFLTSFRLSTFLTATLHASSPLRLSVLNSCQHFCQLLSAFLKSLFTSS